MALVVGTAKEGKKSPIPQRHMYSKVPEQISKTICHMHPRATEDFKENCGKYSCTFLATKTSTCSADMALFTEAAINVLKKPPKRSPDQLWAFRSKEPYNHMHPNLSAWEGVFNYSAGFDLESGGSEVIFRSTLVKLEKPIIVDYYRLIKNTNQVRALWFVSHCTEEKIRNVWSGRISYALALSKYISIDVYSRNDDCKKQLGGLVKDGTFGEPKLEEYPFYLSFENTLCKDYITEKLWKVLKSSGPTIPIALGGLSVEEYNKVAPANSFIHVKNFTSPKALANHLQLVLNSDNSFNYYHKWRQEYTLTNAKYVNLGGKLLCFLYQ